ncbi:SGNH/GDSL hydrolase family protein [Echinicola sediminis]
MKTIYNILYTSALALSISACQYDFPAPDTVVPDPGEADFSKTITVGNSITAGLMDGALYNRSQRNGFAVILAGQLKLVGGGDFNVPDINSENGFFTMGPDGPLGRLILTTNPLTGSIGPAPIGPGDLPTPYTGDKASLNNFGVPYMTLGQALTPLTGGPASDQNPAYNPLYARFASNPGQSTLIGDAAAALADGGTFFSFWLGANDVLGYAIGGASNPSILTSDSDFQTRLTAALGTLLNANATANGIVMNIPNIDILPYFNLVPYNPLPLSQSQADQANRAYALYNGGLAQAATLGLISEEEKDFRTITFSAGLNAFVMEDESLTNLNALGLPSIRQSTPEDKTTLPLAQALAPRENSPQRGIAFPVEDEYVLIPEEQDEIGQKISTFNATISSMVSANAERLVLVDVQSFLQQVAEGSVSSGGVGLNASITPPSGGFSVDGIHPNGRGSAFITNLIIDQINSKWNATIPKVNPNAYVGNDLPR